MPRSGTNGTARMVTLFMRMFRDGYDSQTDISLQLRIILRAMAMLKPGGRLVYSTCSFNPVENEAVVAAALNANPGQYTLVDQSSALPNLKRRPGISTWKIATQSAREEDGTRPIVWHDSYEAYTAQQSEEEKRDKGKSLPETAWAPANAADLGLEKWWVSDAP